MDSEEFHEINVAKAQNRPETDEGPYYHNAWWEAYKGGVKGLMGGLLIGAGVGALVGVTAGSALVAFGLVEMSVPVIAGIVAACSAGGMVVSAHEFVTIGIVAGSDAATQEKAEERTRKDLAKVVGEIKAELAEVKALVKGAPAEEAAATKQIFKASLAKTEQEANRATHCDEHCEPEDKRLFYGHIAAIGAAIGAAAGALLVGGGIGEHLLDFLGENVAHNFAAHSGAAYAATMTTGAVVGASFGINRDLFRKIFDVTDHWFRGILVPTQNHAVAPQVAQELAPLKTPAIEKSVAPPEVILEDVSAKPRPAMFFSDRETAKIALASLDHNTAIRH